MAAIWADSAETSSLATSKTPVTVPKTPTTTTTAVQCSEEPALFSIEVDSPFFQLARDSILLAPEPPGGSGGSSSGGGTVANAGAGGGNLTGLGGNTARGVPGGPGGASRNRNLPKKVELVEPKPRGSHGGGRAVGDPREPATAAAAAAATAAGGGGGVGGESTTVPATNVAVLNFFPRAAGTYPCRVLIKRRTRYIVDVRCVHIAGSVDAPPKATALVFRAPAGQKITQEVRETQQGICVVNFARVKEFACSPWDARLEETSLVVK